MPLSDTISNAEQKFDEQRTRVNDAFETGRDRLKAVVDDAVEATEDSVESGTSTFMEQVAIWRERSLEDLGRFNTMFVDGTRSVAERMPRRELPVLDKLPKPEQVVTDSFDYAIELAKLQKRFSLDLIDALRATAPAQETKKATKKAAVKAA
ncbi:MAG: hypothetical protein AAFZ07_18990 [Actinomycetota bacterium]